MARTDHGEEILQQILKVIVTSPDPDALMRFVEEEAARLKKARMFVDGDERREALLEEASAGDE